MQPSPRLSCMVLLCCVQTPSTGGQGVPANGCAWTSLSIDQCTPINCAGCAAIAGNEENVGAFMQALGYEFRADPVGDADGLLFKRALRLTHPDSVRSELDKRQQHSMSCQ